MIITFKDLSKIRKLHQDKKIVFAGGTFDLIHSGHIEFLENLRNFGDVVVVAVASNESVREHKGTSRPILDENERLRIIDAMKFIDYTLVAPPRNSRKERSSVLMVKKLLPNVFVTIDDRWVQYKNKIEKFGTKLEILKVRKINSTTQIIERIKDNAQNYPS